MYYNAHMHYALMHYAHLMHTFFYEKSLWTYGRARGGG